MLLYVAVTGSQTSGESLKMEMAQEGFSAAFVPGVRNNHQKVTGQNSFRKTDTHSHVSLSPLWLKSTE